MNFFKQILAETAKMLRSKFILISGILIVVLIVGGVPLFQLITNQMYGSNYYYGGFETVTIAGVEYENENQFTWELSWLQEQSQHLENAFSDTETLKLAEELYARLIDFYSKYALMVEGTEDYRAWMSYEMSEYIKDTFVIENIDGDESDLLRLNEVMMYVGYNVEDITLYSEMDAIDRDQRLLEMEQNLADYDELMVNNDFSKYVDLEMRNYEIRIEDINNRIETLEQSVIEDPSQEEYVAREVEYLKLEIISITENNIPELEYRLENNIVLNDGSWQNEALGSLTSNRNNILFSENNRLTEEEFFQDHWLVQEYETYEVYLEYIDNEIQNYEFEILVAQNSLDTDKPDMSFVPFGARSLLYNQFATSMFIAIFGVLIGGWVMATEFQVGTIRLLMIRPRTREKVLLSRFIAGLLLVLAVYFLVFFTSTIVSGIMGGFSDYFYPNYTASGEVNFLLSFTGHFFAVFTSLIFAYSLSFALSVIVKNIAVAIVVPTIALIGSAILLAFLSQYPPVDILSFTPLPYIGSLHNFFDGQNWSTVQQLIDKGMSLSLELGVAMMLVYSAICIAIATLIFRKKDITN